MNKEKIKKTITINSETYDIIKSYCQKNGLKITWFTEKTLLNYITENEKK